MNDIVLFIGGILFGLSFLSAQVYAADAQNVRLIGHSDLQGRETLYR
jgi:hypothetical protein